MWRISPAVMRSLTLSFLSFLKHTDQFGGEGEKNKTGKLFTSQHVLNQTCSNKSTEPLSHSASVSLPLHSQTLFNLSSSPFSLCPSFSLLSFLPTPCLFAPPICRPPEPWETFGIKTLQDSETVITRKEEVLAGEKPKMIFPLFLSCYVFFFHLRVQSLVPHSHLLNPPPQWNLNAETLMPDLVSILDVISHLSSEISCVMVPSQTREPTETVICFLLLCIWCWSDHTPCVTHDALWVGLILYMCTVCVEYCDAWLRTLSWTSCPCCTDHMMTQPPRSPHWGNLTHFFMLPHCSSNERLKPNCINQRTGIEDKCLIWC